MNRYLEEIKINLHRKGFDTGQSDGTSLPVLWNGKEIGTVTENGGVRYPSELEINTEAKEALEQVTEIATVTWEYMTAMETAPPLNVTGLSDRYKILADFNRTVLAGQYGEYGARNKIATQRERLRF